MLTERIHVGDPDAIARAAAVLRAGGLVAFPTETVYGLGARADDEDAVRRIFEAKGRPSGNPLIVHVADASEARRVAGAWSEASERLARAFWPGPLTLVLPRGERIAPSVTAGGSTVAVRVPAHPIARALLEAAALPIAAPSANRSSRISPTTADHVMKTLAGRIDLCLDGGPTDVGLESTIVDVTRSPAVLLRAGVISAAAIAQHAAVIDPGAPVLPEGAAAMAPGGYARHYAPEAELSIAPEGEALALAGARAQRGEMVGALVRAAPEGSSGARVRVEILPADPAGYGAGLYAALHRLDDAGCAAIVVAAVPEEPAWSAVRDRLRRAAAR